MQIATSYSKTDYFSTFAIYINKYKQGSTLAKSGTFTESAF